MQTSEDSTDVNQQPSPGTRQTLAQARFYASDRCQTARIMLQELVESTNYETSSSRDTDELDFCERHLSYLSRYPNLELTGYISNLRLMTRKRGS